ncbi:hypothetical protein XELAEV_18000166mg [Xenopus laevis]|uniref:P2X purinoreceptor 7 intracellular domain-containing protein n=1 Tax=Xenopus laevis TaxID=8355 RepID=A0A974GZB7_XENLA|nr:hypothetical protein XELAEV_18000166mg [Xenopus laevis]
MRNRTEILQASDCFPLNPSKNRRRRFIENRENKELTSSEEASDKEEEKELSESSTIIIDPKRIGNTKWCQCGMCRPMETAVESICCYDVPEMYEKIPVDAFCITDNTEFQNECTNLERQDWNFHMSKFNINSHPRWPEYMRFVFRVLCGTLRSAQRDLGA